MIWRVYVIHDLNPINIIRCLRGILNREHTSEPSSYGLTKCDNICLAAQNPINVRIINCLPTYYPITILDITRVEIKCNRYLHAGMYINGDL